MEELRKVFQKMQSRNGEALKPLTINNYIKKFNKVNQIMTGTDFNGNLSWINQPEKVITKLKESGLKSLKDYISPVVRLLRIKDGNEEVIKRYNEHMTDFKTKEDDKRKDNLATPKEKANAMELDDIYEKIKNYKINLDNPDLKKVSYKLIVCLYFCNQLIARNDYYKMKLASINKKTKDFNDKFNYLLVDGINPKTFVMLNYKTSGTYGLQKFPITNPELKQILALYITLTNKKAGDLLFTNPEGQEYRPTTFNDLVLRSMKEVLGKPINIDLIRKIHITSFYMEGLHSENQIEEFSKRLLHNKDVGVEYKKIDLFDN
jgi:hypothetical protein